MSETGSSTRDAGPARRTKRLTFRSSGGAVQLVSQESLDMICPPSVGPPPEAGVNSGFWTELRNDADEVVFFRVLQDPLGASVEVHSPDGEIRREFGPPEDVLFEVLVPDEAAATTLVLMGEEPEVRQTGGRRRRRERAGGAKELARFDLSEGDDDRGGPS